MLAQAMFSAAMVCSLVGLLVWVLAGGAHRSAHPDGERSQLEIVWRHDPGRLYPHPKGYPHFAIVIGPLYSEDAFGVRVYWRLILPEPEPGYLRYRREFVLARRRWNKPRNLWLVRLS